MTELIQVPSSPLHNNILVFPMKAKLYIASGVSAFTSLALHFFLTSKVVVLLELSTNVFIVRKAKLIDPTHHTSPIFSFYSFHAWTKNLYLVIVLRTHTHTTTNILMAIYIHFFSYTKMTEFLTLPLYCYKKTKHLAILQNHQW